MAIVTDSMGNQTNTNATGVDLKNLLSSLITKPVSGKQVPDDKKPEVLAQQELLKLMQKYVKGFDKEMQGISKYVQKVDGFLRKIENSKKTAPKLGSTKKVESSKAEVNMDKALKTLTKHATKKGSLYTHDIHQEKLSQEILDELKDLNRGGKGGGGGGDAPAVGGAGGGKERPLARANTRQIGGFTQQGEYTVELYVIYNALMRVQGALYDIQNTVLGFTVLDKVFSGLIAEERKFTQEIRQVAYETAGATKESYALMRAYEDINKTVKATGVDRTEFQKNYQTALRRGIKDLSLAKSLTVSQLNTEKQLGIEAGGLADMFQEMGASARYTESQIADTGRGLRDVARFTGVSGKNLADAVASSKQWVEQLKKAGTYSSVAGKNILEISANAKKFGVEDGIGNVLKGLTNSSELMLNMSDKTNLLLIQASSKVGRLKDLLNGTLANTKDGIKDLARGMDGVLRNFGVDGVKAIDKLSDEARRNLNLQLKLTMGIESGEFKKTYQTLMESGKTLGDRLNDITQRQKGNLTLEEKIATAEEKRKLKSSKALEVLSELDGLTKNASSMNEALDQFSTRRKVFENDLQAIGIAWTTEADVARKSITEALQAINQSRKSSGKSTLDISSTQIEKALSDPKAFRELTSQLSRAEQEAATAQKAQLDPLTSMEQKLTEINDNIRNFTQNTFSKMFNSLIGKIVIIGAALTGVVGAGILGGVQAVNVGLGLEHTWSQIKKLFDKNPDATSVAGPGAPEGMVEKAASAVKETVAKTLGGDTKTSNLGAYLQQAVHLLEQIRNCICKPVVAPTTAAMMPTSAMSPAGAMPMPTAAVPTAAAKFDLAKDGGAMAKAALSIGAVALGVVALGAALVGIGSKILTAFNLDLSTVLKTTAAIAAIGLAAGAIVLASMEVSKILVSKEMDEFISKSKKNSVQMLKSGAALMIISAGVVLLGAAIIKMSSLVGHMMGVDWSTAVQTAVNIGAIVGAVGVIAAGINETYKQLEITKDLPVFKNPKEVMMTMLKGGGALLLLAPAITLLAAGVVRLSSLALMGLDSGKAAKIGMDVATVIGAAGAIALGVIGAMAGLFGLGTLANFILTPVAGQVPLALMASGAAALLLLAPAVVLLGIAITKVSQGLMSVTGIDSEKAAKVAGDVASLFVSVGLIGAAVSGALFGLMALGSLVTNPIFWKAMAYVPAGVVALGVLSVGAIAISAALIKLSQFTMNSIGISAVSAGETAKAIASVFEAAGSIASSVLQSLAGLTLLGFLVTQTGGTGLAYIAVTAAAGAAAILILTPAMTLLAGSIIGLASNSLSMTVSDVEAKQTAKSLTSILESSGQIAKAILDQAYLFSKTGVMSLLGLVSVAVLPLIAAGAYSIMLLTPAVTLLSGAIVELAGATMGRVITSEKAESTAKSLSTLLEASNKITSSIVTQANVMAKMGLIAVIGGGLSVPVVVGLMYAGADMMKQLAEPVVRLSASVVSMCKLLLGSIPNSEASKKAAENLKSILDSTTGIVSVLGSTIVKMTTTGIGLNFLNNTVGIKKIGQLIEAGALYLFLLINPIKQMIGSIWVTHSQLTTIGSADRIVKNGREIRQILEATTKAIDSISNIITLARSLEKNWFWGSSATKDTKILTTGSTNLRAMTPGIVGIVAAVGNLAGDLNRINLGGLRNFEQAGKIITLSAMMIQRLPELIQSLKLVTEMSVDIDPILYGLVRRGKTSDMTAITKASENFGEKFKTIGVFLRDGIIKPINTIFPQTTEIRKASDTVSNMTVLAGNFPMLLGKVGLISRELEKNDKFTGLLKNKAQIKSNFMEMLTFFRDDLVTPINSLGISQEEISKAIRVLQSFNSLLDAMDSTMKRASQAAHRVLGDETLAKFRNSLEVARELRNTVIDINGISQQLGVNPAQIAQDVKTNNSISVSPVLGEKELHAKVQHDHTSSKPPIAEVTSTELGDIAASGNDQVDLLRKVVEQQAQLIALLTPAKTGGGGYADVNETIAMKEPAKYYPKRIGQHSQTTHKSLLNSGPTHV